MGQEVWNFVVEVLRLSLFLYILRFHSSLTAWAGVTTCGWDVAIIRIRSGLITCWSSCGISYEWLVNWITTFIFSVFNFFHILDCPKNCPILCHTISFFKKQIFHNSSKRKLKFSMKQKIIHTGYFIDLCKKYNIFVTIENMLVLYIFFMWWMVKLWLVNYYTISFS